MIAIFCEIFDHGNFCMEKAVSCSSYGFSAIPLSVRKYSTRGGTSAYTFLPIKSFRSSSRSLTFNSLFTTDRTNRHIIPCKWLLSERELTALQCTKRTQKIEKKSRSKYNCLLSWSHKILLYCWRTSYIVFVLVIIHLEIVFVCIIQIKHPDTVWSALIFLFPVLLWFPALWVRNSTAMSS